MKPIEWTIYALNEYEIFIHVPLLEKYLKLLYCFTLENSKLLEKFCFQYD